MRCTPPALLLAALFTLPAFAADEALVTVAERSHFQRTGRYDEVATLCGAFARRYPDAVRCDSFGTTPEGRPLQVLVANTRGALTPGLARTAGLPVLLVQGGIHAGEIDGKDAGFLALRQMLDGEAAKGALDEVVLVFVPVFNADGHERFRRWNRPNQRGPEEMGWRATSRNYNLNRDYLKADAPEMRAMLKLVDAWDPLLAVDLHVTDGAKFEHDVAIQVEPLNGGDEGLRPAGLALRTGVTGALAAQGSLPLTVYPSFVEFDNPASGIVDSVAPPRFSTGYFLLRNRFAMLVETHSWKDYPTRVRITRNTVVAVVEQMARHGKDWAALAAAADVRAARVAGTPVALEYTASDKTRTIDFRGYAYERKPSAVSGALMTRYDETRPQVWKMPLRDDLQPSLTVTAPGAGYVVPVAQAERVARALDAHGVAYSRLAQAMPDARVEAFRADKIEFAPTSFEGHQRLTLAGAWKPETQPLPAGSLYVPIAQAKSRLAMALLEPMATDSLAAWGEFNNHFEAKEYMEAYVAEDVARDLLARDPALKDEFERRVASDAAFAKDPAARLEFFYRRHPAWDERFGLYPVYRVDAAPR
jgi:murein tripeptide amidase MpaA